MTPVKLSEFLIGYRGRPFDWATRNCAHFACSWVRSATGRDPMAGLPATPNARAAMRLLEGCGGDLATVFGRLHRGEPIAPEMAQTGDIAVIATQGEGVGQALGICDGRHVVALDEFGASVFLPISHALQAWRLA